MLSTREAKNTNKLLLLRIVPATLSWSRHHVRIKFLLELFHQLFLMTDRLLATLQDTRAPENTFNQDNIFSLYSEQVYCVSCIRDKKWDFFPNYRKFVSLSSCVCHPTKSYNKANIDKNLWDLKNICVSQYFSCFRWTLVRSCCPVCCTQPNVTR